MSTEIERLYREHRAGLVRLVERELRDHHEAEDVVQTAFLDAQCALTRGTVPRNPRAWLAAIALNAAHRLRRRRLNAEPLEEYAVQEASGMSDLRTALASLPKAQRAAVLYRDLLGLSYGETADRMGTTVNAVTMLLHRGRQRLRQTLGVTSAGVGLWRWSKRAGMPQVAAAKGAAAVVVAARVVAPIGSDATAAIAPRSGSQAARTPRAPDPEPASKSVRSFSRSVESTRLGMAPESSSTAGIPPSSAPSALQLPIASLPTLRIPQLRATVATTVTVSTPVVTATVTAPLGTTATATTPVLTVTLPVP